MGKTSMAAVVGRDVSAVRKTLGGGGRGDFSGGVTPLKGCLAYLVTQGWRGEGVI